MIIEPSRDGCCFAVVEGAGTLLLEGVDKVRGASISWRSVEGVVDKDKGEGEYVLPAISSSPGVLKSLTASFASVVLSV